MTPVGIVGIRVSPIISERCLCYSVENVWVSVRVQLISQGCLCDHHEKCGYMCEPNHR